VRFLPGAAPDALGAPAHVLRDGRVPLADLWGSDAERLAEVGGAAVDQPRALESMVADRVLAAGQPAPVVVAVAALMGGSARVRNIADVVGTPTRHI